MHRDQNLKGNILIVDDMPDNLRLLADILAERGYKVRPAPNGTRALATIRRELPDLILLDIMMPGMDGYEVCRAVKENERSRDIPIIFLSALDDVEDKMKGFESGGVDYITKPFHEEEVIARVETQLKIHGLQHRLQAETARLKTLAEAAFEGILIHSNSSIIDINPAAARLFRCEEAELIGADLRQFIPSEVHDLVLSGRSTPVECEVFRKDNTRAPVEIRTGNLPSDEHQVSVTAMRDLTYQREIEQERERLLQENTVLKKTVQDRYKFGEIIGRSPAMQTVYELISRAAASIYPVVVSGESGTGKELVARTIHALSTRNKGPFVAVNCSAVTETLFEREFFGHRKGAFTDAVRDEPGYLEASHKGTLFLDEIGELPLAMQVKLLRVLESGEYTPVGGVEPKKADLRVVAATNRDLADLVRQRKFREDLFYRINVIEIALPPLRERREDIRLLVEHILSRHSLGERIAELPSRLREMLYHYDWPGNVRELMNTIQRYLATELITLPDGRRTESAIAVSPDAGLHEAVETLERRMISDALKQTNWRRDKTAELLGIPRRSLQRKIQKYKLRLHD